MGGSKTPKTSKMEFFVVLVNVSYWWSKYAPELNLSYVDELAGY